MEYKIITQDDFAIISLPELKAQVGRSEFFTGDDVYLKMLADNATEYAQRRTRRLMSPATVTQYFDAWSPRVFLFGDHVERLTEIKYTNESGDLITLNAELDEYLNEISGSLKLPSGGSEYFVTFEGGKADTKRCIKQGILLLAATWYLQREDVVQGVGIERIPVTSDVIFLRERICIT